MNSRTLRVTAASLLFAVSPWPASAIEVPAQVAIDTEGNLGGNLDGLIHDCYNEGEPELSGEALRARLNEADQILAGILARAEAAKARNDVEPSPPPGTRR